MDTRVTMELEISHDEVEKIIDKMSDLMGEYIQHLEKYDFTTWTKDEWRLFLKHGAECAVTNTLMKRIIVVPPYEVQHIPY